MEDDSLTPLWPQRFSQEQWTAVDIFIALIFGGLTLLSYLTGHHQIGTHHLPVGVGYASIIAVWGAVAFRRSEPLPSAVSVGIGAAFMQAAGVRAGLQLAALFVSYSFAAAPSSKRRTSLLATAWIATGIFIGYLWSNNGVIVSDMIGGPAMTAVGWLAGENVRARRAQRRAIAERIEERQRQREQQAIQAVNEERLRIARELHDIVAHAMSVITVQAAAGRSLSQQSQQGATEALEVIESTSRRAMREMRLMVGMLRGADEEAPHEPSPGLEQLPQLVSDIERAGVSVTVSTYGSMKGLPPAIDLCAYRIIQEALTNVVRHVGHAKAHVRIVIRVSNIEIEVRDDGGLETEAAVTPDIRYRSSSAPPPDANQLHATDHHGHGLVGMRERCALFGGYVEAGPTQNGFRVLARIPIAETLR